MTLLFLIVCVISWCNLCASSSPKDNCLGSCYSYVADGYILVHNDGGYVAKFELAGKLSNHSKFCCTSGDYDRGQNQVIAIPINSTDLTLTVSEESFIDVWTKIFSKSYDVHSSGFSQCFEITGSTLEPGWEQITCPGQSNIKALYEYKTDYKSSNNNNIGGQDGCAMCVNSDQCKSNNICGQIGMRNHGGFVAKMCVYGSNNNNNLERFCCTTGKFDESKNLRYLYLPCNATDILVIGEEECAVNQWSIGGADIIANGQRVNKCYEISGSTLNNKWANIPCS